jgi:hypothetical protein
VVSRSDTTGSEGRRNCAPAGAPEFPHPAGVHIIIESSESGGLATGYWPARRWRETHGDVGLS